jgi:hypothetical protein
MLVKVANLTNKIGTRPEGLTKDEVCRVISIIMSLHKQIVEYRIVPEERKEFGTPAIYDQSHFEIIDSQVESDWVVETSDTYVELIPATARRIRFIRRGRRDLDTKLHNKKVVLYHLENTSVKQLRHLR